MTAPERMTRRAAAARIASGALLPLAAPAVLLAEDVEDLVAILGRSRLREATSFAIADAATGRVIEAHGPDLDRQPASVVKILTALYALDALGPGHRFRTALSPVGDVQGGRLKGIALVGGGDPVLDTDALARMAERLRAGGVTGVDGALLVDATALPAVPVTEPDQPAHAGYNPAVSGLNLNFNRVHFAWASGSDGRPSIAVTAPGNLHTVPVERVRVEIGGGAGFGHRIDDEAEVWRLAPHLTRGTGSIWLPVRRPADYAAEVFAALAAKAGIDPGPEAVGMRSGAPGAKPLVLHESGDLASLMRGMLRHSTNLTAEAAGLAAARAAGGSPASLAESARAMSRWASERYGLRRVNLFNHSGLTIRSTLTARETLAILTAEREMLEPILPERPILDARGEPLRGPGGTVRAKTGTMHYLRGLAGYLDTRGRRLAFVIYASDLEARAGLGPASVEPPPGARNWLARARGQENALLRRWAKLHTG